MNTTLSCPSNNFVGLQVNFKFNNSEPVKQNKVQVNLVKFSFSVKADVCLTFVLIDIML